jgi:hypothetical protein
MAATQALLSDLRTALRAQLPAQIRDLYTIEIAADSYFLRGMAMFIDTDGYSYSAELEGMPDRAKIPDEALAWLCLREPARNPGAVSFSPFINPISPAHKRHP